MRKTTDNTFLTTLSVLTERRELALAPSCGADIVTSVVADYNITRSIAFSENHINTSTMMSCIHIQGVPEKTAKV